ADPAAGRRASAPPRGARTDAAARRADRMTDRRAASIELSRVTKQYGSVTAVRDVSFTIAAGSLVTLLGPSGCGKTTTLRLIAGLETVTSGRIRLGGDDVTALGATERNVSMVFQSYALFPHMSVLDNVAYGPRVGGQSHRRATESARAALAGVGLAELADRLPCELSGGQQQRVAIARALVLEPLADRTGRVTIGGLTRTLPHRGLADGAVDVAIRPEAILIVGQPTDGALRGSVKRAAYLGSRMEYSIASEIGELFVTSPAVDTPLAPGATVALTLTGHGITLIRP